VTCAVGPNILKFIAPVIAKGIGKRSREQPPLVVIACENAIGATDTLAGFIKDPKNTPPESLATISDRARFANSAVDRIVPAQDPDAGLNVKIESFFEWVVDETPFAPRGHPHIIGVHWVADLTPYIERKLYTVNTSHATAAYFGHNKGVRTIHEAMEDKAIHDQVRDAVLETSYLIINKHGITANEQKEYAETIIQRISNPHLEDVVERVGRAPLRKLSRKERFIGPAAELAETGASVTALLRSIELAFRFQDVEGDEESFELAKILKNNDAKAVVKKVCGLTETDKLFPSVVAIVEKVKAVEM
jgi:mannitol-1-phosphate 5-dehydrogenase